MLVIEASKDQEAKVLNFTGGATIKRYDPERQNFEYSLHLESRVASWVYEWSFQRSPWKDDDPYGDISGKHPTTGGIINYWSSGFLSLQYAIDDIFIEVFVIFCYYLIFMTFDALYSLLVSIRQQMFHL